MADIMWDVDEVICPTIDSIHELALERGIHDGTEPMRVYKGWLQYGIPEDVYWDLWSDFALSDGYLSMKPIPGAVEAMRRLVWEGHRIHLVTARGYLAHGENIKAWTDEWLHEHAVPHETLSFTSDKVAVQDALGVQFDYAIDDRFGTVEKLRASGVKAYLMTHTHNDAFSTELRVNTADEFVDIILEETK